MKQKIRLDALIQQARGEQSPGVDVAGRVLTVLAARRQQPILASERLFMWLAAASSAAAVPAAILGFFLYNANSEPLREIAKAISWIVQ
jgi:hypothetical protein